MAVQISRIWRVVRVVEGAALEIFFAKRKPIFPKAFNRAVFGHLPITASRRVLTRILIQLNICVNLAYAS